MSDRSVLVKDDDEDERFGPEPNSSSLEMLELPSNLFRFARISYCSVGGHNINSDYGNFQRIGRHRYIHDKS